MQYRVEIVNDHKTWNDFLSFPYLLYKDDKNWVAPFKSEVRRALDRKNNPYYRKASVELFNCYRNNAISTRVAVIINNDYNSYLGNPCTAFFGFFESINDQQSVNTLFSSIEQYCISKNIYRIEGPFNPNHYSELGMSISEEPDSPSFFQTYNPYYYNNLLQKNNYNLLKKLHTRINRDCRKYILENFGSGLTTESNEITTRIFDVKNFKRDLEYMRQIYNDAFSDNWHFIPLSYDEYLYSAKYLNLVTPPELIRFVEYKKEPVAVVQFTLNINPLLKKLNGKINPYTYLRFMHERKKIKSAQIFATGVKNKYKNSRITRVLFNISVNVALNFEELETTWMYDDNKSVASIAEKMGLTKEKEFVIYYKDI